MIVAVTYENDMVFQHFGRTQKFELYTIEDGKITGSEVVGTNGAGHHDLAPWLRERGVEAVICGGIGTGMIQALQACGIVTGLLMGAQLILYLFLQNRTGGQVALAAGSLAAQYVNGLSVRDQLLYNLASAGFLEVPAAMRESAIVSVPGGYALSAAVVNELLLQLRSMIGLTVESLVPSLFITGSGLNALLGLSLGIRYGTRAAQTRAFRRDEELQQVPDLGMPHLREWHLPRPWGLRIGVLGIGYFLARYASGGSLVMLGQLMFQVFALCFGVQGLASMNASQHKRGSSRGWRTAVVVMALVFRFMQIALIIMGVVDQIINVRGLRPPMRPHGEEEE